ncbi:MAG: ATP-dependent DNA helicase RecG [Nitrospirota bacterium]
MTDLKALLETIKKPILFASRNNYAQTKNLSSLEPFMRERIAELKLCMCDPSSIAAFEKLFLGFDTVPLEEKKSRLKDASSILFALEKQADHPSSEKSKVKIGEQERTSILRLDTPIQYCKGIGPKRAEWLNKLGITTVEDALFYLPARYEDRSNLKKIARLAFGSYETISGTIVSSEVVLTRRRGMKVFELVVTDKSGMLIGSWFNQPFMKKSFKVGQHVILSGVVKQNPYRGNLPQIDNPDYEILDEHEQDNLIHTGRIVPIYRTTAGLSVRLLRSMMRAILDSCESQQELLPAYLLEKYALLPRNQALEEAHFPSQEKQIEILNRGMSPAHRRMSFEELFLLELGLVLRKQGVSFEKKGIAFKTDGKLEDQLRKNLPFTLTEAQERVITTIKHDMAADHPMNRLVQGDVGCGKTIVAMIASLVAVESGYQTCIMAPTEILAEQHYKNFKILGEPLGIEIRLLTGRTKKKERDALFAEIASGAAQIVIGTHALIEDQVRFQRLGLAIIDEQHRFGVMQRSQLTAKGYEPDVLVMTATPIPRTLALTVYGDLDVSVIDEMPKGRMPIKTVLYSESRRTEAYRFMESELAQGRQIYIVYPLIEETEKSDLKAATEMAAHLQKDIFPERVVGLMHGKMKPDEKEAVMASFVGGTTHILVSTTVIEVGVDVPNATIMVIEHSERFGLAQLHQLRGRVGRGCHQSFCVLMAPRMFVPETRERLHCFLQTNDGFLIAEQDLRLRGPGEFFGTRQSGLPDLRAANILRDADLLETARQEALLLTEKDPSLQRYPELRSALIRKWKGSLGLLSVG